ncbi:hypothetical protein QN219_06485 [Sinorhizobium sp. 7-81]|nr:hypothetical protein [Sinorhizobium sp. 8-89]MDK1489705.1 hypothetical protein [Sinorhizobium sp. 8-89]
MSYRLVFSVILVTISIMVVWAFRPEPTIFTGYKTPPTADQINQSDRLTQ